MIILCNISKIISLGNAFNIKLYGTEYSETCILWTPWDHPIKISWLSRCPHFLGQFTCFGTITKCPDHAGVPINILMNRFHCTVTTVPYQVVKTFMCDTVPI